MGCEAKTDDSVSDSGRIIDTRTDTAESETTLLPEGFENGLTDIMACTDTFFGASNPEKTVALTVLWYGLLQAAIDEGPQDRTVEIEEGLAVVELSIGEKVSVNWCTDALEVVPDPIRLRGVSGEMRVQASTRGSSAADGGSGSVRLTDLLLVSDTGEELRIEEFEMGPVDIFGGWGG